MNNKSQIKAHIVADSVSKFNSKRITTFVLEMPRFIWAECLTHRLFSRNAASSRAIPIKTKISMVWNNPAIPVHFGKNQSGMQANEELSGWKYKIAKGLWKFSSKVACCLAWGFDKIGLHKQIACRILEPFEMYRVVVTATDFKNWFWLRRHKDAQPEIRELADCMYKAMCLSVPVKLKKDEWHTPFYKQGYWKPSTYKVSNDINVLDEHGCTLQEALMISSSCAAQTSYRKLDDSLEKANNIFNKLIESKPCHASPTEHQATPIVYDTKMSLIRRMKTIDGVTSVDKDGQLWSGNFCGWIQHRQLIKDNVMKG